MLTLALSYGRPRRFAHPVLSRLVLSRSALFFVALGLLSGSLAAAQFVVFTPAGTTAESPKPNASFQLPTQSNEVKDSLDEFQRMVKHEQWEKAFKALEAIAAKTSTGYIDRSDGVLVPSRMLVRGLLAALPPAGKNAYRLFYDSQATALWDKAVGKAETDSLASIVTNHLISSVGDRAADRLGDAYFEQGELEQAVIAWRSLLNYCPESSIPQAQTLAKIATALARSGRHSELRDVERTVRERYATETVQVGGRRVAAGEYLVLVASTAGTAAPEAEVALPADFELPSQVEPLWQFRFQSKDDPLNPNNPFSLSDVYGRQRANDFVMPAATDGKRLYVNVFGIEMAFDLKSGKLVWRSGKLHLLQLQQNRQGVMPERYSMTVWGNRTYSVGRDAAQNNGGNGFALIARDADTGKELFSTRKTLSSWNILGAPFPVGDGAEAVAPLSVPVAPPQAAPLFDFADGFAKVADRFSFNSLSSKVSAANLQLTDNRDQKGSIFLRAPLSMATFQTQFTIQLTKAAADGMTFTIQGSGPTAIGNKGVALGYGGLEKSLAVKFDLHNNSGEGNNSTGLYVNGAEPGAQNSVDLNGTGIDLHCGHPFDVAIDYDGTNLQVSITDSVTKANDTRSYPVDIPAVVGSKTAYMGFTAATGGEFAVQQVLKWKYAEAAAVKSAAPLANTLYVGGSRNNQGRELAVLVLNAKDGKLIKTITVGNHAVDQNQVYGERIAQPTFLAHRGRLYVDTHAGALVSLQPQTGNFDWGILYESPPPQTGYYYYEYQPPQWNMSGPVFTGGMLFAKGMRSTRLLGIEADGPAMVWNRPVSTAAVIVGADQERIYMAGDELAAYSLKTQELLWATQLPRSAAWSHPLLTENRLYQFTSRGVCEVDKATGDVLRIFRGADLDSYGGTMFLTPTALVTVSNLMITAYPLNVASAPSKN